MACAKKPGAAPLTGASGNFVEGILQWAVKRGDQSALLIPNPQSPGNDGQRSYAALQTEINRFRNGFLREGLGAGDRVIILFRPDHRLYSLVLALLASGLIPVFIDTGMPSGKIVRAIRDARAQALVSTRALLRWRWGIPGLWRCRAYVVDADKALGARPLGHLQSTDESSQPLHVCDANSPGLITFTSGSTGRPKGVNRTHHVLIQQHQALQQLWPVMAGNVGLTSLPIVVFSGLSAGCTNILADCDLAAPGLVDPRRVVQQLMTHRVNQLSGAPAFIGRIAAYVHAQDIALPDLQAVFVGGAAVPPTQCRLMCSAFPNADIIIVYGSTEAEPISSVRADDVLASKGTGILVGKPVNNTEVVLANLPSAQAITAMDIDRYRAEPGNVGEVLVKGSQVVQNYVDNPQATRALKIPGHDGHVWHRTGDLAYQDPQQRLWLTGRCQDRLLYRGQPIDHYPVEQVIDALPGVARSALISTDSVEHPVLFIEAATDTDESLHTAVHTAVAAKGLSDVRVHRIDAIPMDGRHNSKIDRPALRRHLDRQQLRPHQAYPWIVKLNSVDAVTLIGVAFACFSCILTLAGQFALAISVLFTATLCDAIDGILARHLRVERPFGRYLDGFADTLTYLVVPCLWLYQWGLNSPLAGLTLVIFLMAGITRLAVFNHIGNIRDHNNGLAYWGMPVFWSVFLIAACYLLSMGFAKDTLLSFVPLILVAYAIGMLYGHRSFKFKKLSHIVSLPLAGSVLFAILACISLMNGVPGALGAALLYILVVVVGGSLHMLAVTCNWLPGLARPLNLRAFGANKTWRGIVLMPLLCIPGSALSLLLAAQWQIDLGVDASVTGIALLGGVLGMAYLLSELPNSWIKRRLGISPGQQAQQFPLITVFFDQCDAAFGIALVVWLVFAANGLTSLLVLLLFPGIVLLTKRLLYRLKLKPGGA